MHLYEKKPVFRWRGILITLILFFGVVLGFTLLFGRAGDKADQEQTILLENALRNAAVTNYAIEGQYPATLEALIDSYGIIVDDNRFLVRYDVDGYNMMPEISVVYKGEYAK